MPTEQRDTTQTRRFGRARSLLAALLSVVLVLGLVPRIALAMNQISNVHWDGYTMAWDTVDGADHYKVLLYRDGTSKYVQRVYVFGSSRDATLYLKNHGYGSYTFTVVAEDKNYKGISEETSSDALEYKAPAADETFDVTVVYGTSNVAKAKQGDTVTITAEAAPAGKQFEGWTVDHGDVTLAAPNSETTTFTMPASTVKVTATYKVIIDAVDIAGVTEPVIGASPNWNYTLPADANYTISDAFGPLKGDDSCWFESDVPYDGSIDFFDTNAQRYYESGALHSASDKLVFKEGKYYTFLAFVAPKDGFVFKAAEDVAVAVNGKKGYFLGYYWSESRNVNAVRVGYTFGPLKSDVPDTPVTYTLTKGDGQTVTQGDEANFVSNAPFGKFSKVLVDDVEVDAANYTAAAGSTDVTFKGDYSATLSVGIHSISIVSEDGQAGGRFTVKAKAEEPGKTDTADTGKTDPADTGKTDPADTGKTTTDDKTSDSTKKGDTKPNATKPGSRTSAKATTTRAKLPQTGDGTDGAAIAGTGLVAIAAIAFALVLKKQSKQR